jgi:hypothetical protein
VRPELDVTGTVVIVTPDTNATTYTARCISAALQFCPAASAGAAQQLLDHTAARAAGFEAIATPHTS